MQPRQADATPEDDSLAAFSMNVKSRPLEPEPNRKKVCYSCGRLPEEKQEFSKCARCRGVFYCSRECQKKDWADHKKFCEEPDKQRAFIVKCIGRMNLNADLMRAIGLALGEELLPAFTAASDNRKMWVACANLYISPDEEGEDFKLLTSPDIPLKALLDKPMQGRVKLVGINDVTDMNIPIGDRIRVLWQKLRDDMDRSGYRDTAYVALLQFGYNKSGVFFMPFSVYADDLARIRKDQEIGKQNNDTTFKPFLFIANRVLGSLEDSKGRPMRCALGEHDKILLREWSINRVRV
ncbi:hypothetical protein GALMADRAFT_232068 [Galerina marginata CBS 339.88]|uniref:MYND-type domain-containing protein n=1 Tax=Galerina marginata (strain CBS 339.88) TaxID=685588 RepID=A0A067SBT0_GALM3|nr:hypothetical protein GALMADRAFT_232068 [Galerina marginata CBS 339.88]